MRGKMMMHCIEISINETPKAFRVNGVTVAKRHLEKTMGRETRDFEKMLAKFLVIVPFLHKAYEAPEGASESVQYGATKAHALYKALRLTDDAIVPFMLVCLAQANDGRMNNPQEAISRIGAEVSRSFRPGSEREDNVISFADARKNRTLH
jgi:hypothetical protein